MEQHEAVKKMMLTIELEGIIPKSLFPLVRNYLKLMYCVGWDQGRQEVNQHGNKLIAQYDEYGKLINTFKSLKDAVKRTGFSNKGIRNAMKQNRPCRGYVWKYLKSKDEELANRDNGMY